MATYSIGLLELGNSLTIDFPDFIELAKGRAIISAADWGSDRFEIGLSGNLMLRVFVDNEGIHINLIDTTNPGEIPPLILRFPSEARRLTIRDAELRLRALRTLYALTRLSDRGELSAAETALLSDPSADIEALLPEDEHLRIEALGPGSWLLTIWTKVRGSYKALITVLGLLFSEGRDAFLRKLEAEARMKELEAEREQFKLLKERTDYSLSLVQQMPTKRGRKLLAMRVEEEVYHLLNGTTEDPKQASIRLLGVATDDTEPEDTERDGI